MMRLLICIFLIFPALAVAEMIIDLSDGRRIVVPVNKADVKSISFPEAASGKMPQEQSYADAVVPGSKVWRVGGGRTLKYPGDAAKVAKDGDTIEIDAGVYPNDHVKWAQNDLTIRGVGGMAHMQSSGLIRNGKAIWIIRGNNTVIENIEFSGAAVRDSNGAGIRHEGGDLTLRNTYFHHNEFSVLTGTLPEADIQIESSRFWFQKRKKRHSHGIYIGRVRRFTLTGSHVKGTDQGHQVKSRALENRILYNRIEDAPGGNSSRLMDLANCGLSFVIGNDLHQGPDSGNLNVIGYGAEACSRLTAQQMRLYVINNTLVNEAGNGTFVNNHAGAEVLVANNLVFGEVEMLSGEGTAQKNFRLPLGYRRDNSWTPAAGSTALDAAAKLQKKDGMSLVPDREFSLPVGTRKRPTDGALDIGSREVRR